MVSEKPTNEDCISIENKCRLIHILGALTSGIFPLFVWITKRQRDIVYANEAFDSLLWNISFICVVGICNMLLLVFILLSIFMDLFAENTGKIVMLVSIYPTFIFLGINIIFALRACTISKKKRVYPYPLDRKSVV